VRREWPSRFCCDEELAYIGYDGRDAASELVALRARGPRPTTLELIDAIRGNGVDGAVVIDVGAGVGAVHLALLEAGAVHAIDVDASKEYISAAREEAERRGLGERVEYRHGDLVELAADLPRADVVVLDSVICCYPYLGPMLEAAVRPGPRLLALTYPRDTWWMRLYMRAFNAQRSLAGSPERYFTHRHEVVRGLLGHAGFREVYNSGSPAWRVCAYARS
jgi:SAM-dependent methyltransferase